MMNRSDYCLTESGSLMTKASFYLQEYLNYPKGSTVHASVFEGQGYKKFLEEYDFIPVTDNIWEDYLEIVKLMFNREISNCEAKDELTKIEKRGNIEKGLFEIKC